MVSFNEAINIVREHFIYDYVTEGFEYDGEYVFRILSHDYKKMYFQQAHLVSVNINTGELELFEPGKAFNDLEGYAKAQKKSVIIDSYE